MVVAAFIGLFVMSSWSRVWGMAIIVLSCFFLIHTGGKTASAMLPAVLLISWAFERFKFLRIPIAVGGIAMFNLVAVGAAVSPDAKSLVTGLGIDATFTNRADIWRYAFSAIADRPILGYGFQGFWQTPELVYSGDSIETWAVAAFNGHNSMLDITISTGIPGLVFTLLFVLILPLRSLSRGDENGQHSNVTRLFVRVWLYLLYNAGLETMFFEAGPLWFLFAAGLYAFRLRTAELVTDASENRSERPFTPASLARI
jgi:O-antigen ligase